MRDNSTRANHGKEKTDVLKAWFKAHAEHPFPTEAEKRELEEASSMNRRQLNNWFINGTSHQNRL
jgi:hypothetical protein